MNAETYCLYILDSFSLPEGHALICFCGLGLLHSLCSILHSSLLFFRSSLQASCLLSPYQSLHICLPWCWGIIVLPPFFLSTIITVLLHGSVDSLNRYRILLGVAMYTLKNVDVWECHLCWEENKASDAKVSNNSFDNSKEILLIWTWQCKDCNFCSLIIKSGYRRNKICKHYTCDFHC